MINKFTGRVLSSLLTPLGPLLAPSRPGNVAMFHIGRCGSTVVGQLLKQHRRIYWASELYTPIFLEWQRKNAGTETVGEMPADAIDILRRNMRLALHRFYGFEVKPFHFPLIGYSPESFVHHLEALGFSHFILLDRKNRLRKIVSSVIAHQEGAQYHIRRNAKVRKTRAYIDVEELRIDFDTKPLLDYLCDYDEQIRTLEGLLKGRKCLKITYEEDVQKDPRVAYSRICDFLGLDPSDTPVRLSRTNPFPVREMIENVEEVEEVLHGTPYEWMLSD